MRALAVPLSAALGVLLALAGCLGAGEDPDGGAMGGPGEEDAEARERADAASSIEGTVVNEGFEPIEGALVQASRGGVLAGRAATDSRGNFEITGLESLEYVVQVSAPCCKEQVYRVHPAPGAASRVAAVLEELPRIVPYVDELDWTGHIGCSGWIPGYGILFNPGGICASTDPNDDPTLDFKIHAGLQTVVVGMEWEKVGTNLLDDLRLRMHMDSAEFFKLNGPSPLERYFAPEDATAGADLHFDEIESSWEVRFTVTAAESGNIVLQQPFTLYYHLYYVHAAPEGARALP